MANDVKTTVFIMQTDGKETNLFIYGAKSTKEFSEVIKEAFKIDKGSICYIDDIDNLVRGLIA